MLICVAARLQLARPTTKRPVENAIQSYQEAVKLDPSFALAWAYLSCAQSGSYWVGVDSSPARLAAAKDSLDRALALNPNLPETHLALGYYRYYGQRDYTGGLAEFQQAEQGLPNNVDVITAVALIQRRLGHWDEAIGAFRRIVELDPRYNDAYNNLAQTYRWLRRFPEAVATADRLLAWEPADPIALGLKASSLWWMGDLQAVEPLLANPGFDPHDRGVQALFQRRYAAAIEIISSVRETKTKATSEATLSPKGKKLWLWFPLPKIQQRALQERRRWRASTLYWGMPVTRFPFSSGYCRYRMPVRSRRHCCDSIRCGIQSGTILVFKNWPRKRNREREEIVAELRRQ